ncbi:MAG: hypothetical protein ACO1TE_13130 [Prosthecobacter sp.]
MPADEMFFAQGWDWDLTELQGQVVKKLYAFTFNPDDSNPEKMMLELESGQNHSFFAGSGCYWHELDEELHQGECDTYEDARVVDYTERFGLRGQTIERVWCADSMPLMIQIKLSGGLLTLTDREWEKLDLPAVLSYVPSEAKAD